jgi:DtxR family Mn-dependent transcriptional regulator
MVNPALALAVFGVLVILTTLLLWPRWGLLPRLLRAARLDERIRLEDALKHVYTCERRRQPCSLESMAGRLGVSTSDAATLLARLSSLGLVRTTSRGTVLTEAGTESAVRIVRTHRMWERYLADRTGVPPGEWHDHAERMEHALSPDEVDALEKRLGHPRWDPHGDPIPTSSGEVPPARGISLVSAEVGRTVEIVHLEDEPQDIYDALLGEGMAPGVRLDVLEVDGPAVRVRAGGREWSLDPVSAQNVTVRHLPPGERARGLEDTLADTRPRETVEVVGISPACQGIQRRRLLDLGVVPGTRVTAELTSAAGDPVAYDIRGALIALRREQAAWIYVRPAPQSDRAVV